MQQSEPRAGTAARDLGQGLWGIRVPALVSMLRGDLADTRSYLIACAGGFVLVDSGWSYPPAWAALEAGVTAAGYVLGDCRGVLVTHSHPDHHGMSARLREETGCWVALHPIEAELVSRERSEGIPGLKGIVESFFHAGAPQGTYADIPELDLEGLAPEPALADRLLEDGQRADVPGRDVRAVWTPGHAPGHLAFHLPDERLLLSGDHVLPKVSPYIGLWGEDGDPLGDYLAGLRRVAALAADHVLPGHGEPFTGLTSRVQQLLDHHEEHLSAVLVRLAESPATLWDLASAMPWSSDWETLPWMLQHAALGEARAHVRHLERTRRIRALAGPAPDRYELASGRRAPRAPQRRPPADRRSEPRRDHQ